MRAQIMRYLFLGLFTDSDPEGKDIGVRLFFQELYPQVIPWGSKIKELRLLSIPGR